MISRRVMSIHAYWVFYSSFHDFQKRIFMGFQSIKLWVEFSIWIWYSKIIIEFFKRFYEFMSFMRFYEFSSKVWVYENLLRLWVLRCDAYFHQLSLRVNYHHCLYDLWVVRWAIPMRRTSWVMSYELWVWVLEFEILLLCIELSLFVEIVHIAPRVSLDGIRKDSYIKSIDVH